MINLHEIKELINLINDSSIEHFEYEKEECKITLKKSSAAFYDMTRSSPVSQISSPIATPADYPLFKPSEAPVSSVGENVPPEVSSNIHQIVSPMVGTFYCSPSPDEKPFVSIGSRVTEKNIVGTIEAMKLYNEIEAEQAGEIVEIHVQNGQFVEFGQPLFSIKI